MIRLRQHVPAFVNDGAGGWTLEALDLGALLALPQVAVYAADVEPVERDGMVSQVIDGVWKDVTIIHPAPEAQRFHQWSRSDNTLIVEHNGGDRFWVVGFLSTDDPSQLASLPTWTETETAKRRREAWNRGDPRPSPKPWRCAEHGVAYAACCLKSESDKE